MDEDELELLDPPPPPPPPDDELELLEVLDPVEEDDEDELELDGVEDDELDDDVLEVLGADELLDDELADDVLEAGLVVLEVEEPVGDVGPLLSQPIEAARPIVIAPPLRRRRKSRRAPSALSASFSSIFRSFWLAIPVWVASAAPGERR